MNKYALSDGKDTHRLITQVAERKDEILELVNTVSGVGQQRVQRGCHCCHACSMSKGVILRIHIPYTLAKQKHRERTNSANSTQRSKVAEAESSMIETEATELKYKDFVVALYLMGMHDNKAEELACTHKHPSAIENSTFSGICLYAGWD